MAQHPQLHIQCFVKQDFQSILVGENDPKLLYVSRINPDSSRHPRVMHAHEDYVEVLIIFSGSSEFLIHNKKYMVQPGDLIVYNPNVVHDEISGAGNEIGYYCVAIGGLHMPGLRENALIRDDAGYVFRAGEHFEAMRSLCEMMFHSLSTQEPRAEAFCHSLMHALIVKVLAVVEGKEHSEADVDEPNILGSRIKSYIDRHYMEPITLQSMGEALHVSPYYLSHVFKEMSGYSPMQYLLRRRIGEAQTLLITSDLTITEIAGRVGYDTQSYFNLQFSKHVGMPPNQYRKNYVVPSDGGQTSKPKERKKRTSNKRTPNP